MNLTDLFFGLDIALVIDMVVRNAAIVKKTSTDTVALDIIVNQYEWMVRCAKYKRFYMGTAMKFINVCPVTTQPQLSTLTPFKISKFLSTLFLE